MRDHLLDLVEHTYDLGCIDLVKITGTSDSTVIDGLAEDRSVVVQAAFKQPVAEFEGTFGMPNLAKLKVLLGLEPYKKDAKISMNKQERNGAEVPVGLHFENQAGDFKNDYRFMTSEIIEEKLKVVKFKGVEWNIEFEPTIAGVQRLKYQAMANAEELTFNAMSEGNDLKFEFGDHSTHAGSFIFQPDVNGKLSRTWSWPVRQFISILDLTGDKTVHISDQGAAQITVDSGLAVYQYILPAQSK
jgi:hypothetical protein